MNTESNILRQICLDLIRRVQSAPSLDEAAMYADMSEAEVVNLLGPIATRAHGLTDSTLALLHEVAF